jgi:hypothetical protein
MKTMLTAVCLVLAALIAATGSASASAGAAPKPLVAVVSHGGLCISGAECRTVFRITDTRISAVGFRPRRLAPAERRALLRAIRALDLPAVRARPFRGTCPIAYDGTESIYRFRSVPQQLASCTYDLRTVQAVRLTDRLLASLQPR